MEVINRYIYAVVKQLPQKERKEVEKELHILIDEMMEAHPDITEEEKKAKRVIEKLGNPDRLAEKYRERERYLIGPGYFNQYIYVLKIVLLAVFLGITIASFFGGMGAIGRSHSVSTIVTNYIGTLLEALLQGTAWVTVIFSIIEYKKVKLSKEDSWSIKELPPVPNKEALISRGESIFTIIFSAIFFSILYFSPQLMGIYYMSNSTLVNIPIFDIQALNRYNIIIMLIFIVTIVQESLKIIWGRWNSKRAIIHSVISIVSSGITIMFFSTMSIWNSKASEALLRRTGFEISSVVNGIVMVIVLVTVIEIATTLYKGFKYGN